MLLALWGDISLNPGPASRSLNGCLLNIRSIENKSLYFLECIKDNNAYLIAVIETWLRPEDTEGFFLLSPLLDISSLMYLKMSRKGAELAFIQGGPEF